MASFEFLAIILTGLGLTASIVYYASILRNANKTQQHQLETRQLQLYTTAFQPTQNKEWMSSLIDVVYNQKWEDYEDFMRKYGPETNPDAYASLQQVIEHYQMIGLFVEQKALDLDIVNRHHGKFTIRLWEKVEPYVIEHRKRYDNPMHWHSFEYLYNEIKKLN